MHRLIILVTSLVWGWHLAEVAWDRLCVPQAKGGGHTGGRGQLQLGVTLRLRRGWHKILCHPLELSGLEEGDIMLGLSCKNNRNPSSSKCIGCHQLTKSCSDFSEIELIGGWYRPLSPTKIVTKYLISFPFYKSLTIANTSSFDFLNMGSWRKKLLKKRV